VNGERDTDRLLLFAWCAVSVAAFLIERARQLNADHGERLRDAVNHAEAMEARVVELSDTVEERDAELDAFTEAAEQTAAAELARRKEQA
jgi:hypothetical protein